MENNPDKAFLDLFMLMIGALIGSIFGLILLANYIADKTQRAYTLEDTSYQAAIEERIKPVGRVALDGETIENAGEVVTIEPVAEVLTAVQVYNQACVACHGAGIAGAPKTGDSTAWAARLAQGEELLHRHAIEGYQGSAGYMPPKGGHANLSDEEVISAVDYLVEQAR